MPALALDRDLSQPCIANSVVGFRCPGEAPIGLRVLVPTADQGLAREGGEPVEGGQHLCRRAFEHPAAAEAEKGIAAKQESSAVKGDMAQCMARDGKHIQLQVQGIDPYPVAVRYPLGGPTDAIVHRCEAGNVEAIQEGGSAADVVGMVMGQQDGDRYEALLDSFKHWTGVAGIHDDSSSASVREGPDVVVVESWQGTQ